MRVTRFCSAEEFRKYMRGETLYNSTKHQENHQKSKSVVLCFVEDEPDKAFQFLKGVVDLDYCVVFGFDDGFLTESEGRYNIGGLAIRLENKKEWCCEWYNNKVARLVDVSKHYLSLAPSRRDIRRYFGI